MKLVFDTEANELLLKVSKIHCFAAKDIETQEIFTFPPNKLDEGLDLLASAEVLIGHNIIGYDLPTIRKLYNWSTSAEIVDTLIWSRILRPDRPMPKECPTSHNGKIIGPHSVEAWGYRVGRGKVEDQDWSIYTPEMMHRCVEDVEIQYLIYLSLLEEMKE